MSLSQAIDWYAASADALRMAPTAGDVAAANVRGERSRRRWTQAELAERLGWSQSKVSALEAGQRRVTLDQAVDLCRVFDISLLRLLQDADEADVRALRLESPQQLAPPSDRSFRRGLS